MGLGDASAVKLDESDTKMTEHLPVVAIEGGRVTPQNFLQTILFTIPT